MLFELAGPRRSAPKGAAPTNKLPAATIARIRSMWADGYSLAEIAASNGCSPHSVSRHCADLPKRELRGKRLTTERVSVLMSKWVIPTMGRDDT